jgi:cytidylate kinase
MGDRISVAIDGPSGAGKSTLARAAAERFGFLYVDTGAIYRTVGLAALRAGLSSKDTAGVEALLPSLSIALRHNERGEQRMFLGGEDVSADIRMPEASLYASDVSAMPAVRAFLWKCSAPWRGSLTSSWTGATSAPLYCRTPG